MAALLPISSGSFGVAFLPQNLHSSDTSVGANTTALEMRELSQKTQSFISLLEKSSGNAAPLRYLVERVFSEGTLRYSHLLFKQEGYISRLFSNESWTEWLRPKTAIGEVVLAYKDFATTSESFTSLKERLDPATIKKANMTASTLFQFPREIDLANMTAEDGIILEGISEFESIGGNIDLLQSPKALLIGSAKKGFIVNQGAIRSSPFPIDSMTTAEGSFVTGSYADVVPNPLKNAGDVDGDGEDDLILGAPLASNNNSSNAGCGYFIKGSRSVDVNMLNGTRGFIYCGTRQNQGLGSSVSGGDINGDRFSDLAFGSPGDGTSGSLGNVTVINGGKGPWPSPLDSRMINGANGFIVVAKLVNDLFGLKVVMCDVNGDGRKDLIISAPVGGTPRATNAGVIYVVNGQEGPRKRIFNVVEIDGSNGRILYGKDSFDMTGLAMNCLGDLDGDGAEELGVGAEGALQGAGKAYIVRGIKGRAPKESYFEDLDGKNGFTFICSHAYAGCGRSINTIGDITRTGKNAIAIGAPQAGRDGTSNKGQVYVYIPGPGPWPKEVYPKDLDGFNGFTVSGGQEQEFLGNAVSSAGNFYNRTQGSTDFAIASLGNSSLFGRVYVLKGRESTLKKVEKPGLTASEITAITVASIGIAIMMTFPAFGFYIWHKKRKKGKNLNEDSHLLKSLN